MKSAHVFIFVGVLAANLIGYGLGYYGAQLNNPSRVTRCLSSQWSVPANSGLGPPLTQVKAFVLYDDSVCMTVMNGTHLLGLRCVPKKVRP